MALRTLLSSANHVTRPCFQIDFPQNFRQNSIFRPNFVLNTRKMKLLTHNMLSSKCIKGVNVGYPLGITASDVRVSEVDFNPDFIAKIIPKIDWDVLWNAAESIGQLEGLPKQLVENYESDRDFLKKTHHVLMEVDIINGHLTCPESGRKFPINNGIPNMLLNEDEV